MHPFILVWRLQTPGRKSLKFWLLLRESNPPFLPHAEELQSPNCLQTWGEVSLLLLVLNHFTANYGRFGEEHRVVHLTESIPHLRKVGPDFQFCFKAYLLSVCLIYKVKEILGKGTCKSFQHTEYRGRHHRSFATPAVMEKPCLLPKSYEGLKKTEASLSHFPESHSLDTLLSKVFL